MLALVLGVLLSAGLYFAYLWPSVEPVEPAGGAGARPTEAAAVPTAPAAAHEPAAGAAPASPGEPPAASQGPASPAP